ncbi:MAG TPA: hypothetical protein PKH39_03665 [Woeseiaceae bacterium]|nr:hypothetical protein [Woeseiaceae bacterium]
MSDSIYAPPKADIEVPEAESGDFYVVSPTKFYLLSVLTLNLYYVYWFYRNWRAVKVREGSDIWPVPRAIFFIFFTHSLFNDIDAALKERQLEFRWSPTGVASFFVLLAICSSVLDRMANKGIGSPTTDLVGTALVFVTPILLIRAQNAINFLCGDPFGSSNSRYTLANWVWMILGGLFWLLILFGVYALVFAPELLLE